MFPDDEKIKEFIISRSQLYTAYSVKDKFGKYRSVIDVESVVELLRELYARALQKIANPIKYLQEESEKEGTRLDGYMAIQLTKDANFYQEIARKALEEITDYR